MQVYAGHAAETGPKKNKALVSFNVQRQTETDHPSGIPMPSPFAGGSDGLATPADTQPRSKWPAVIWVREKAIRQQQDTCVDFSFVLLAACVYGVLFFSMGTAWLPGHAAWCTLLLWASSLLGALVAHQLYLPRVIGMLAAGMLLRNLPWSAIDAFPSKWGTQMRAAALATIFLRCGLELDVGTMKRFKFPALRLALLPGLAEALFDAGLGTALFDMDFLLALTMGFILKAVGPGLVVPAMFRLQKAQLGTDQGIPSTVVISASFDDVVAITGYAICSTIAIRPAGTAEEGADPAWSIASGPVQVIFGILGGLLFGYLVGATRLWDTRFKRIVAIYGSGLFLMFMLEYWNLLSGGALGALFVGLVASNAWEKGVPRFASLGPSYEYSPEIERWLSVVWRWIMEPILFVTVGSTLDFDKLSTGTIPKSVLIVCTGVTLRVVITFLVMSGFGYTNREKVFYAIAWTPKATVQAALSAAPLTLITELKAGSPDYEQWEQWGNDILTTGLFAIIICGTLGVLAIHYTAPLLLEPATESDDQAEHQVDVPPTNGGTAPAPESVASVNGMDGEQPFKRQASAADVAAAVQSRAISVLRSTSAGPSNRPSSPQLTHLIPDEDYAVVAEYIDAIGVLTTALRSGQYNREELLRLADHVMHMQRRIEVDMGRREPSVRELFRTASELAAQRPLVAHRATGPSRSSASLPTGRASHDGRPKTGDDGV